MITIPTRVPKQTSVDILMVRVKCRADLQAAKASAPVRSGTETLIRMVTPPSRSDLNHHTDINPQKAPVTLGKEAPLLTKTTRKRISGKEMLQTVKNSCRHITNRPLIKSHLAKEPVLTGDDSGQPSSQRKRKAPAEAPKVTGFRPLKKAKGSFNRAYLDILNEDIEHAAAQYVPLGRKTKDGRMGLPSSQIGMVIWTSMEKERFFEALGRLGRDDSPGIARRIRTKGEMEVRQYLMLLQDGLAQRRQQNELDPMELADFPAAAELSHECCEALDEVADSLAWRQESFEQSTEQHKHGPDWLVTQESCNDANQDKAVDDDLKPSSVLNTSKWLQISERLFMNGTSAERNWRSVDGDHPSIRRTTRDDFYSLALTLTRRLVAATIFIASSRIRTESGYNANKQSEVRRKDVRAAVLSLGLRTEKQTVLAGSARRLGLHVYEHPPKPSEEEDKATSMPYDAIEHALGMSGHRNISSIRRKIQRIEMSPDEDNTPVSPYSPAYSEVETGSVDSDDDYTYDGFKDEEDEDEDVRAEADEIILYSAVDQPQTKRDRETLFRRIKADREQESYADAVDAQATYQEEKRMWEVLGKQPPQPLVDPGLPPAGRRLKVSVDAAYSVGKNWRAHTKVASEWEMSTPTAWMRNYYAA
ncbi:putative dna-binding protein [Diaporthe ampelina]|uniref:Putative dna-binding protein n=1 Tax=Diaporthe ampelina TaxID=1214573 RepID=A0A0G2HUZ4_9PEZI|nr:putative dna-binding protein [Diaporthe ampelina]